MVTMDKRYLALGKIVSSHGIHGELRLKPMCGSPAFALQFKTVFFGKNGENPVEIISARVHKNIVLMRLDGFNSIEDVQACVGKILYIDKTQANLEDDEYFIDDLIGCTVLDVSDGEVLGKISDVTSLPSNDVWHIITSENKEVMIPKIPDVIKDVDIDKQQIKIFKMKGLFDSDED